MKKLFIGLTEVLHTFIIILGIQFLLLMVRVPFEFPNDSIIRYEMQTCFITALVFAVAHVFIFSDRIVERMPIMHRCLISFLPCAAAAARLVYEFSNASLLGLRSDGYSRSVQVFDMYFSVIAGAVGILIVFFLIEIQFRKIGKRYDKALQEYKKSRKEKGEV